MTSFLRWRLPESLRLFETYYRLNFLVANLGIPAVAIMDGIAMGTGAGLGVNGTFSVATEKTVFAMPEVQIGASAASGRSPDWRRKRGSAGLFPDQGSSHYLSRLPHRLGFYLGLLGERLEGKDVYWAGLASHFIPSAKVSTLFRYPEQ